MTPEMFQTAVTMSLAEHHLQTKQLGWTVLTDYQVALCSGKNTLTGSHENLLFVADTKPDNNEYDGVVVNRKSIEIGDTEYIITNPGFTKDAFKHLGAISVAYLEK